MKCWLELLDILRVEIVVWINTYDLFMLEKLDCLERIWIRFGATIEFLCYIWVYYVWRTTYDFSSEACSIHRHRMAYVK